VKRVISVTTDRQPGGIANALINYSRALHIAGYNHLVVLPEGASVSPKLAKEPNVVIKTFPLFWLKFHIQTGFIFTPSTRTALVNAEAMLVHNARTLAPLSRLAVPQFCINHSGKLRHLEKARNIIFLSSEAALRAKTHFQKAGILEANHPQSFILPHGFFLPARKTADASHGKATPHKIPVILAAGRFVEKKGFADLIDAAAILKAKNIACTIDIYGAGELSAALASKCEQLGVHTVNIKGWTDDLAAVFRGADIFCLPSHEEPFGLILGEAMLAGLPVIASNTDGPSDILGADGTDRQATLKHGGLLFPSGNAEALAEALIQLLTDKSTRKAAGIAGQHHIQNRYSLERQAEALQAILALDHRP
jgi:glycosyltransferase involved in cell wall biosynthesis